MATAKHDPNSYGWSILRVGLGFVFLWAFIDKLFGLGFATCKDKLSGVVDVGCSQSWAHGGSPTDGFLGNAVTGPFANFYHNLAGNVFVDWAFMLGLLFVGLGLFFGTWIKSAAVAGMAMMALMWSALLWPANTPGVDEHVIYFLALFGILTSSARPLWTIKQRWIKLP